MKVILRITALMLLAASTADAQISLVQFAAGMQEPVDIKNAGDSRLFVVERRGNILIYNTAGTVNPQPFLNIQNIVESTGGEQGLLGLAFAPDYATSGYFYCYYIQKNTDRIHVSRFSVSASNPDSAVAASEQLLLDIYHPYTNHNGGHLAFGPDGYLYIGTGDGGSANDPGHRAQNLDSLLGKMLRIDVSGAGPYSIPTSNPFISNPNARDEIWMYGLRNPWRWSFDRFTGNMWIGDVGQNVWEEIDLAFAGNSGGQNYGWRCYEGLVHTSGVTVCSPPDTVNPVYVYSHGGGNCSVSGGYIYRGAKYANMFGKYFFADYCLSDIRYLEANGSGGFNHTNLGNLTGMTNSFSGFGEDQWGELYAADLSGRVYKFTGQPCAPVAHISDNDTIYVCGASSTVLQTPAGQGFNYVWTYNGSPTGGNSPQLTATQSGTYNVIVFDAAACSATSTDVYVTFVTPPAVSFTGLDTMYCVNYPPAMLTPNPAGGVFSGWGVTGNSFNPSLAGTGIHAVIYTFTDANGCIGRDTQYVHVDACTGINENYFGNILVLNSINDVISVRYYCRKPEVITFEIVNSLGQVVYESRNTSGNGINQLEIPLHTMAKGIYMLKLSSMHGFASEKFIRN